jgi:hypothetical protein
MDYNVSIGENGGWLDIESGCDIHGEYTSIPVMQYTGLKDKNGKEIYEGDILLDWEGLKRYVVEWNEKWACFQTRKLQNDRIEMEMDTLHTAEAIGNIYENPELLAPSETSKEGGEE